ncbi:adenosine receptor A3-like [Montipora capricornis]|uniref:adenosine receptor A3-like n=1 Tax=Montipora capricornis TaxID=246305 RepID=UPI0035F14AAA
MNSTNSTELSEQANRGCFYLTRFLAYDREPAVKILFIVNCALNAILSITAIVGNASIFWALRRCSSTLRPPSKALLSSLTLSDLAVGLFVQPLYVVYKAAEMNGHFQLFCITGIGFHLTANVFQAVSFLTVTAIALDRFLAFHLQKLYTRISATRAKVLLVILWSATSFWIITWFYNIRIYQAFNITAVSLCLILCASAYITLQYRLRGLQTAITSRLNPFNEREANISIQTPHLQLYRRSVTTMFYIYILLILCYTPYWSMFIVIQLTGRNYSKIVALSLSMTILFANASLNPFLYCWRIQEIRREIVSAISKLCRRN